MLRRVAVELDAGRPVGALIAGAAFGSGRPGYDKDAVDGFLEQLRRQDHSELAGLGADPWRDLPVGDISPAASRATWPSALPRRRGKDP